MFEWYTAFSGGSSSAEDDEPAGRIYKIQPNDANSTVLNAVSRSIYNQELSKMDLTVETNSDGDTRLYEIDCEESEESADMIDKISVNPDVEVTRDDTEWIPHNCIVPGSLATRNVLREISGPTRFMKHNVNPVFYDLKGRKM
ncbi:uncharacterized protein TNCV_4903971 [Trichonephila clavipes]|nr:uncharacterized protein TNCV_4903971 [Trichonephila clavipes]